MGHHGQRTPVVRQSARQLYAKLSSEVIHVTLPNALPQQLYLLAYDSRGKRFAFDRARSPRPQWMFEYALRSAVFTDLYLSDVITDDNGRLSAMAAKLPDDPVLRGAMAVRVDGRTWLDLVRSGGRGAVESVGETLKSSEWIRFHHRRLRSPQVEVRDVDLVESLRSRVVASLNDVLRVGDAEPRSLALGLIAFHAQMPVMEDFLGHDGKRHALHELTEETIEPIRALHTLIQERLAETRRSGAG